MPSFVTILPTKTVSDPSLGMDVDVPDVGPVLRRRIRRTGPGHFQLKVGRRTFRLRDLGAYTGGRLLLCQGPRAVAVALRDAGFTVVRPKNAPAAVRTALQARGVRRIRRVSDGVVVGMAAQNVVAGSGILGSSLGDDIDNDETYEYL